MLHAATGWRKTRARAASVAFALAVCACMLGLAGAARADGGLVQYTSADGSIFEQPALSSSELGREWGEGLDAQAPSAPGTADGVATILWDEVSPRGGSTSASLSFGGSGSVSVQVLQQVTTNIVIVGP